MCRSLAGFGEIASKGEKRPPPAGRFPLRTRKHVHVPNVHLRPYDFEVSGDVLSEGSTAETIDLVKRYPKARVNAVDGVSFAVAAGEVFGLLGPNGGSVDECGKSGASRVAHHSCA